MEWIKDLNTWNTEENLKLSGGSKEGMNKYMHVQLIGTVKVTLLLGAGKRNSFA